MESINTDIPVRIIDCLRDAMQGIKPFIPTKQKVKFIQTLLQVGFDVLDCGSFVSPHAIPQMKDTGEVIERLNLDNTKTRLLVIIANYRGAKDAVCYPRSEERRVVKECRSRTATEH